MLHKLGSTYSYYVVFLATRMMIFFVRYDFKDLI